MTCTVKRCWPDKVSDTECHGDLQQLSLLADSPEVFLRSKSAWATARTDNPQFMWQVLLSQVNVCNFLPEEVSFFTICAAHEVN